MKKAKKVLSLFLIVTLFFSSSVICSYAESVDDVDARLHSVKGYLIDICGFDESELNYETIDNVDYIYTVTENEASIVNIHDQYRGEEKIIFTLPLKLGDYPVTAVGDEEKKPEVFWYINYGEDIEFDSEYYPEYDPASNRYLKVVVPEGYKNIYSKSMYCFNFECFDLPDSLRYVGKNAFSSFCTDVDLSTSEKKTIIPECFFSINSAEFISGYTYIAFPSRFADFFHFHNFSPDNHGTVPGWNMYIPSNVSYDAAFSVFYKTQATAYGTYDVTERYIYTGAIFHCAPDSPWLQIFEDMGGHSSANIITDITPAEYIEFPEETVNIHVGDVVDLEAKTYPTDAIWTACDYEVSDPSIVKIDDYSGRITALKEGTVTVTATHCERGFVDTCTVNVVPEAVPGVNEVKPATDTPYFAYGNRDYSIEVTGSPSKIQVVRDNGGTTTIDRRKAQITSNGETETWIVNMRVEAGTHSIRAKYGKVWDERITRFTVKYDTPKAHSLDFEYENGIGTFEVVTDPSIIKVRFLVSNGCTLTYSQNYSYIAEDGMRHWVVTRKLPANTTYTLATKLGYTWTTTDFTVNT